jgi:two-component system response regulator RegA
VNDRPLLMVVEDDDALRHRLARAFDRRGFEVVTAASATEAEALLGADTPEFVVMDLRMPDGSGLDLIARCKQADAATRIVVLTGYGSIATAIEAVRRGALDYLTKPADADQILAAFKLDQAPGDPPSGSTPAGAPTIPSRPMSLDRVEWEHINRVLMECQGNVSEAARLLGLHRRSLQRKLSKVPGPQ